MAKRQSNEGKAIDAVIRFIEQRDRAARASSRDPEAEGHREKVDQVCTFNGQLYAFEHTEIEPFDGYIQNLQHNSDLFDPVIAELEGLAAPDEYFEFHVPFEASVGIAKGDLAKIRAALCDWIRTESPLITPQPIYSRFRLKEVTPPGVPFSVAILRFSPAMAMGGRIGFRYGVDGNREESRIERIRRACNKKYGKLAAWKKHEGARSIAIFEDRDFSLTNTQSVADALAEAEKDRTDCPDEVYAVTTHIKPWYVTCLRRSGKSFYDEGERYWEVDPERLTDLTGR